MLKKILSVCISMLLLGGIIMPAVSKPASAATKFTFKGSMSEEVLKNYLARAVTFEGLCGEGGDENFLFDEDLRMIQRTGAKFISRAALFAWTATNASQVENHYQYAKKMAKKVHAADSEIILQAFVAEIVRKSYVNNIKIPSWVFEAFGKPTENRNFSFDKIIEQKKGPDYWGAGAGYPDWSNEETQMWYYYCIRRYIDAGYESIHIQEGADATEHPIVDKVLNMGRDYAKKHARRGIVLFHNFFDITTGGSKIGNRLIFDIQGNGLVPNETVKETVNGQEVLKCRIIAFPDSNPAYWCTWFGRSNGGEHPLGFTTDICPTILEFDNYGQQGTLGVSNGPAFGTWGYDDITWFATQPEWYRNEFLLYLDSHMKSNCLTKAGKQAYFPVYPMRRVITAQPNWPVTTYKPGKDFSEDFIFDYCESIEKVGLSIKDGGVFELTSKGFYRANRQSAGCPNGFNQEDTIRQIFLGKNAPENPKYDAVVLPEGYQPTVVTPPASSSEAKPSSTVQKPTPSNPAVSSEAAVESETSDASEPDQLGAEDQQSNASSVNSDASAIGEKPKKSLLPGILITLAILVVLAGCGVGGYFLYQKKFSKKQ